MIETWKALFTPAREWLASLPLVGDLGPYAALTLAVWAQSVLSLEIWRSTRRPSCSETPHRCAGSRSTQRTSERTTLRFRRLDRGSAGTQFTTQLRRPVRSRKRHASQQVRRALGFVGFFRSLDRRRLTWCQLRTALHSQAQASP